VAVATEDAIVESPALSTGSSARTIQNPAVILGLVLVLASLVLYNPAGRYPFLNYDDDRYVSQNIHVQAGLRWSTIRWAFTTTTEANWHPLTWLSHELDWQLFHSNPAGHHYGNVLLHAINVCLLFFVLLQATGFMWRSWIVAALFALHPINVESVAWIAERKNLLSMFFFLLALAAYRWYAQKPGVTRYTSAVGLFALGLMAKPQVVTFPFLLLLWDYWPLRRIQSDAKHPPSSPGCAVPAYSFTRLVLEKLPLFALSAASCVITIKAQAAGGAVRSFHQLPLDARLGNGLLSYARYVGKAVWPSHLAVMYPYLGFSTVQLLVSLLLLVLISAVVIVTRRRYLLVGWLWFLGTLLPMIGIVQVGAQAMADRYAYLSFIGLFVMTTWGVAELAERYPWPKTVPLLACSLLLIGLGVTARRQLGYWRDSIALWTHTIEVTGPNFQAQEHLASALADEGRTDEAGVHFETALAIDPTNAKANLNLAVYDHTRGRIEDAIRLYRNTLQLTSDEKLQGEALTNLGWAYYELGNLSDAESAYQAAVRLKPQNHNTWIGMGLIEERLRKHDDAANAFSRSAAIRPSAVDYLLLETALEHSGRRREADAAHAQAQRISSDLGEAQGIAQKLLSQ